MHITSKVGRIFNLIATIGHRTGCYCIKKPIPFRTCLWLKMVFINHKLAFIFIFVFFGREMAKQKHVKLLLNWLNGHFVSRESLSSEITKQYNKLFVDHQAKKQNKRSRTKAKKNNTKMLIWFITFSYCWEKTRTVQVISKKWPLCQQARPLWHFAQIDFMCYVRFYCYM